LDEKADLAGRLSVTRFDAAGLDWHNRRTRKREHGHFLPGPAFSGSGIARNVVITDLLSSELEYVNSDPQPSDQPEAGLVWQVLELAPNQKKVFVVNVKTKAGLRAGTVIRKETRIRFSDLNGNRYPGLDFR
jgi:Domain of unknown function DUF11